MTMMQILTPDIFSSTNISGENVSINKYSQFDCVLIMQDVIYLLVPLEILDGSHFPAKYRRNEVKILCK